MSRSTSRAGASISRRRQRLRGALVDDLAVWRLQLGEGAVDRLKEPLRICNLCVVGLHVGGCAISMVTPAGNGGVVCATDDTSARIEDLQFSLGEGPGLDAV